MYQWILFDLDGTLTDPGEGITNSVAYALRQFGITPPPREQLYPFIGPPLTDSCNRYYGFTPEQAVKAVEQYRVYFAEKGIYENRVYDGIKQLLESLRQSGRRLAVASSKPEPFVHTIMEHFSLGDYFDFVGGALMDETRIKKGDVIAHVIKNTGISDRSQVLMVGDRAYDVWGATEQGLDSAGVLYGYGSRAELAEAGATYLVEYVSDLAAICLQ